MEGTKKITEAVQKVLVLVNRTMLIVCCELSQAGFNDMFSIFFLLIWLNRKYIKLKKIIILINELDNYYILKPETELSIPAQTGNRTMKMYTSIERILSVDVEMQLMIELIILII